jgi:hypothetical protein
MFGRRDDTQRYTNNGYVDHARVTIRELAGGDAESLRMLAERDTARGLRGDVVGAERDGRLLAAISLADGTVVADPFHPTADLVTLLRVRVGQVLPPVA